MSEGASPALGIVAGGGDLPLAIAESAREAGREVFVLALLGSADEWVASYPHEWASLGEVGKAVKALRGHHCGEVLLAGKLARPKFSEIKLDAKGVLAAPRVIAAARHGDDALLRSVVDIFEREGFQVVGATEASPGLLAPSGQMGHIAPSQESGRDVAAAFKVVRAMGALDIGQAAVVCEGLVLAVEAAEGTDAMVARIAALPEHLRGTPVKRRGVLVKAPKPIQDRKTDLPVVGVQTVTNAAAVGLAGIAVEARGALILRKAAVIAEADRLGLFLLGVAP
ncbi:MAG: UDP-2,3-diacylglucosamine diphosphatase LpxI [Alphaproteobacteria bacterium]|nr:UDP-2,3-diacylglucosamine diphosphatase LpxI [Alphaproteobacteria bacterium]MDE2111769.1 UDP-2,3-diacylglucosamine diphosphatase LpxI [Alphaproteobacteria bacterium]MDE2494029.1 UDP-2,3-diacylglucosamine diphosphatase LpxI [Alphaproteobacteria bacterium]